MLAGLEASLRITGRGLVSAVVITLIVIVLTWVIWQPFAATFDDPQTTFDPKSTNLFDVQNLYWLIFWLAGAVFVGVMALTLIFSIAFRERPGREPMRHLHGNSRLEVVWTLIPVAIVVVMAIPTFTTIVELKGDPPGDNPLEVAAIGHQWWFEFQYPEYGIVTANELHVPVDRAVDVSLLSEDVIHSFWVPQITGKTDMVPGHENSLWFQATEARPEPYLAQCAEFCGTSHANMRFRVFVHTPEDFEAWAQNAAQEAQEPEDEMAQAGQQVFLSSACVGCHTIGGTAAQGEIGPNLTHFGSRTTFASSMFDNTPENLAKWIRNAPALKPGVLMPAFPDLTEEQIQQLVAYLESLE